MPTCRLKHRADFGCIMPRHKCLNLVFEKSENCCIILLEMVEGVIVLIIGTILLVVAVRAGIGLAVDLINSSITLLHKVTIHTRKTKE